MDSLSVINRNGKADRDLIKAHLDKLIKSDNPIPYELLEEYEKLGIIEIVSDDELSKGINFSALVQVPVIVHGKLGDFVRKQWIRLTEFSNKFGRNVKRKAREIKQTISGTPDPQPPKKDKPSGSKTVHIKSGSLDLNFVVDSNNRILYQGDTESVHFEGFFLEEIQRNTTKVEELNMCTILDFDTKKVVEIEEFLEGSEDNTMKVGKDIKELPRLLKYYGGVESNWRKGSISAKTKGEVETIEIHYYKYEGKEKQFYVEPKLKEVWR